MPFALTVHGHHYSIDHVLLFVSLVLLAGVSLRAASEVFSILQKCLAPQLEAPHWTTGRMWLLRLGYYKLHRPKEQADDWVWFVDHSVQIGQEKCLNLLGARLCQLPPLAESGRPLCHQDMEIIDLLPVRHSDGKVVYEQLEANAAKTGVPRAIVEDHGSDLHSGVEQFCRAHPGTVAIYDITHKAACLLKARLEKDARWAAFCSRAGQTKSQVQQTELAFLAPPRQRSKARYMNLAELLRWGRQTLEIVDAPAEPVLAHCTPERLDEKLGWLREYRQALAVWSGWQQVIDVAVDFVRREGLYLGAGEDLRNRLEPWRSSGSTAELAEQLIAFVTEQSAHARPGERLPGTTEVLESCFGKLKHLEGDQCRSGFTGLLLSLGAMVSETTTEVIENALSFCKTKDVWEWVRQKIGATVQAKRAAAYRQPKEPETKPG